jgi:ribonuclease D
LFDPLRRRQTVLASDLQCGYTQRFSERRLTAVYRALSSAVEHYLDMVGVTGSIPVAPTILRGHLAQTEVRPTRLVEHGATTDLVSTDMASNGMAAKIHLHNGDLPGGLSFPNGVAIDTETLGLRPHRDRLCLVQLSSGDGTAHLVQLDGKNYQAANLKALLTDTKSLKIFHFARFDVAVLKRYLGVDVAPIYCTKIASKLVRTYTDRHGLKDLCLELAGVELSKQQQSSDWAARQLSPEQQQYAASDVLHLHAVKAKLDMMLDRDDRRAAAEACFKFLPTRAALDLAGFEDMDMFSH